MASFIIEHLEEIVAEWESFARTLSPASATMDVWELRDHAKPMLEAIAKDIETSQSSDQQEQKSKGHGPEKSDIETAAASHGALRHTVGFDLQQLVSEFRALRASVLKLWVSKKRYADPDSVYEMTRFNESIDQALMDSTESYSKELSKSRDTFLAFLGHDLRMPLNALASAMDVLSTPVSGANRAEALAAGTKGVSDMSAMISDLLEFTRKSLGKGIPITPAWENLESVCKTVINEVSLVYPQTAFRFESGGRLEGTFDGARMRQVVSNLLKNAVQHGKPGTPVTLVARGEDEALTLQVTNQGPPIASEIQQVIFDPLVQIPTEGPGRSSFSTLGLGLFVAREIVLAHAGTIHVSSSAEDGTTFAVELPRANLAQSISEPGIVSKLRAGANGD